MVAEFLFHLVHRGVRRGRACRLRGGGAVLHAGELGHDAVGRVIVGVQFLPGARHLQGIVNPAKVHEQKHVMINRLRTGRTKRESLRQRKVRLFEHALLFGAAFGMLKPPFIDAAANRAAQFGKGLLGHLVANKPPVPLEPVEIMLEIDFLHKIRDFLYRRVISHPISDQAFRIPAPELMVPLDRFIRHLIHRLPVDFHDDTKRRQVGIHPVQRKTFLDEKLIRGAMVEDHLA